MTDLYKILQDLVSFKTISSNYKENYIALKWIENIFKEYPLYFKHFQMQKHKSLLVTTQKTKKPKLLLAAHIDVVPGLDKLFNTRRAKGKIIGRGVFDMKYAIASYIKLIDDLKQKLPELNIGILITTDEEMGGFYGSKYILNKGYRPKVCFLPDGGSGWRIIKEAKGIWVLKVKSYGKIAHSSKLWFGQNANLQLIKFLIELQKFFKEEPCGDKFHKHSSMSINLMEGGKILNQVPDYSEAILDIRFLNNKEKDKINMKLRKLKEKYRKVKTENIFLEDSFSADINNEYFKIFSKVAKKHRITKKFMLTHGSSDARHFKNENIPTIVLRPKGGAHHTENEWIDEKDFYKFYRVLKDFALKVGK